MPRRTAVLALLSLLAAPPARADEARLTRFGTQLLLGSLTGPRLQLSVPASERAAIAVEATAGALGAYGMFTGFMGAGARCQWVAVAGPSAEVLLSPGAGFLVAPARPRRGVFDIFAGPQETLTVATVTADVEVIWQLARRFALDLGAELGVHDGLAGLDADGRPVSGRMGPVAAVFAGLRF